MRQRPLNPMMSSVIICPVVRLEQARRWDKSLSLLIAIAVHIFIFVVGSFLFVSRPKFAVDQGEASVEVDLIAAFDPIISSKVEVSSVKDEPELFKQESSKEIAKEQIIKKNLTERIVGKDHVTARSSASAAITSIKTDYLHNPAPYYPESARRKGQQGLVLLNVLVDRFGKTTRVEIKQSSGFKILDQAAAKVVWKWKFKPAYAGTLAVDSSVDVPIRFKLKDHE